MGSSSFTGMRALARSGPSGPGKVLTMKRNKNRFLRYILFACICYIAYVLIWGVRGELFIYMSAAFATIVVTVTASALGLIKPRQ